MTKSRLGGSSPEVAPVADGNPHNYQRCQLEGCTGRFYARNLCYRHYLQWYNAGRPEVFVPKRGRITKGRLPARFTVFTG